jgi:hypothetical protein
VRKYDTDGSELWTSQFGSSACDRASTISVDASGVYVAGFTMGSLPGQSFVGFFDAFVRKYSFDGSEVWTRQFGTPDDDEILGVSVDASGVYVAGFTNGILPSQSRAGILDAFVRKYDLDGNELWTRQFGTLHHDVAQGVSVNPSGVYVSGYTLDAFPGYTNAGFSEDAFVRKYDLDGNVLWTRQFGTPPADEASAISVDVSGVYVAGFAGDALPDQTFAGFDDAFVRKYDFDGNELWTRQFGSDGFDRVIGISKDVSGVYLAGWTELALPGQTSAGGLDAFASKYDSDGNGLWTRQFGSQRFDEAHGISVGVSGIYLAGLTSGILPGQTSYGNEDAFVIKLTEGPVEIGIDIKPGSDLNSINTKSRGVIPVAILTSTSFDATGVDPSTVRFGRTGTETSPVRGSMSDVDSDGDLDFLLHFKTQEAGFRVGDSKGIVTGQTLAGISFTGSDAVRAFSP